MMTYSTWIIMVFTLIVIEGANLPQPSQIINGSRFTDPQVKIVEGSEVETVFFEHLIHLDSEKFQSLNADSDVAPPKPTGILQVAGGQVLKLMRPLLHIQVFTGLAEELKSNTVEDQFSPPITFYNNEVALETKDPIGITKIVTPGQFDNSNTDLTPTVANTVNANTASTAGDKGFWDFIFGSNEPKKLVDYLIGAVSYEKIASSGKSSPKVLSPSLMSVNPENDQEKSGRLLLSPSLFSLHNRSDSLINIPEVLRESPELYGLVKAVVEEIMLNRNQHLAEAEATKRPTNRRITNELEEKEDIPAASSNKGKLSWLRFDPVNITNDDILVVENFHNKWKSNATLREEWRNWYKHNRNLTDVELDKLMRLNASASSFDQVLHDAVINMPFILTPENASSPGILSPVIASPYILSPYIFGPFILSPLVLTPQILTPSLLSPSIINPYVLSPLILSPGALNPSILSPYVLSPSILSPQVLSPAVLSPTVLSPCILSPKVLSPDILGPSALSPSILCPTVLSDAILSPGALSDTYCPGC